MKCKDCGFEFTKHEGYCPNCACIINDDPKANKSSTTQKK